MTPDPDADVLALVDRGDLRAASTLLMRRHGAAVYRFCREALQDATLADDVHQQVFIEALRDLAQFARRSTLRTWLFAIARHRVLDAIKSRRRARGWIGAVDAADVPDRRPAVDAELDDAELQAVLVRCIAALDDDLRTVLLLRFQQGMTFEDIARVCRKKPGTLQARVARVLPQLRLAIEREMKPRDAARPVEARHPTLTEVVGPTSWQHPAR